VATTVSESGANKLRTTWTFALGLQHRATWRYFGAVDNELTSDNPFLGGRSTAVNNVDKHFAAVNYFDLAGSYNLSKKRDFAARDQQSVRQGSAAGWS